MQLNKPSGLTLEQFKKVLSDEKDKNKIFENNAEYFYNLLYKYFIWEKTAFAQFLSLAYFVLIPDNVGPL